MCDIKKNRDRNIPVTAEQIAKYEYACLSIFLIPSNSNAFSQHPYNTPWLEACDYEIQAVPSWATKITRYQLRETV